MALLGRAVPWLSRRDPGIRRELDALERGFTLLVAVEPSGPFLGFARSADGLTRQGPGAGTASLELRFRDVAGASRVLGAHQGLDQALAGNRLRIRGSVGSAMIVARILSDTLSCLYPSSSRKAGSSLLAPGVRGRAGLRVRLYLAGILFGRG
jgi:hypothetical protein